MNDCPFCDRIAADEYDYSDPHAVAFEPLNPVTPGHLLVVPRRHVRDAGEDPEVTARTMSLAADIAGPAEDDGAYNLITSAGRAATQSVFHLHIHLIPRREGDGLHLPWTGQNAWPERCGYCYCLLADAPECADGCGHRDLSGHVGCAPLLTSGGAVPAPRRSGRRPKRGSPA